MKREELYSFLREQKPEEMRVYNFLKNKFKEYYCKYVDEGRIFDEGDAFRYAADDWLKESELDIENIDDDTLDDIIDCAEGVAWEEAQREIEEKELKDVRWTEEDEKVFVCCKAKYEHTGHPFRNEALLIYEPVLFITNVETGITEDQLFEMLKDEYDFDCVRKLKDTISARRAWRLYRDDCVVIDFEEIRKEQEVDS